MGVITVCGSGDTQAAACEDLPVAAQVPVPVQTM